MEAEFTYGTKQFPTQKELFDFLFLNKKRLIAQKRAVMKTADCISCQPQIIVEEKSGEATKEGVEPTDAMLPENLKVKVIINTTNWMDMHSDVHIPGLWGKSLSENKMIMHLQEHEMDFEKIIADGANLKAYVKPYTWKELGYSFDGTTEGLTFESTIEKKRNEFMLKQYKNGWVRNHSVGMYYVKVDMAINDESYPNEFDAWKKYFPMIINSEVALAKGYFWYVLEAKCIEGSAVPLGSNSATPTMMVEGCDSTVVKCTNCGADVMIPMDQSSAFCTKCGQQSSKEPPSGTQNNEEPDKSTQKGIDYNYLLTHLKN